MTWSKTTLPSGLKVAHINLNAQNSLISVFIKGGSSLESKHTQGYSHLLEHLILNKVASKDVNVDGYTTKELIALQFSQKQSDTIKTLKTIKEILYGPTFYKSLTQKMIDDEKSIILKEFYDVKNNKEENKIEKVHKTLDSTYKYPILGGYKNIQNFNIKRLKSFFKKIIQPTNIVFCISSNLDKDKVLSQLTNESKHKAVKLVEGFNNYEFLTYLLLQEIFNADNDVTRYLPYKDFGLFISPNSIKDFTEVEFNEAKNKLMNKITDRFKNPQDAIDDLGYSLLYFDLVPNHQYILQMLSKLTYKLIKESYKKFNK